MTVKSGKAVVYNGYDKSGKKVIRVSRVLPDGKLDVYTTYYLHEAEGERIHRGYASLIRTILDMVARGWEVTSELEGGDLSGV